MSRQLKPNSISVTSESTALPPCDRIAPLGRPVVPEVYISVQGSEAATGTAGSASLAAAINAS